MNDETVERIELRIAFLEKANTELSDVVYRQQRDIDALKLQLVALESRLETVRDAATPMAEEQERPPHY